MLETMNLLQKARHGCSYSTPSKSLTDDDNNPASSDGPDDDDDFFGSSPEPVPSIRHETPSFIMQDSIKTIAEEMAKRFTPSFLPTEDEYTTFASDIEEEKNCIEAAQGTLWSSPFLFLTQQLSRGHLFKEGIEEHQIHEIVVASLMNIDGEIETDRITDAFEASRELTKSIKGGDRMEEYMTSFLPSHLIRAESYGSASELLVDQHFISRRVSALGVIEATRMHIADLFDLRREVGKSKGSANDSPNRKSRKGKNTDLPNSPASPSSTASPNFEAGPEREEPDFKNIDTNAVMVEGSRRIIDEVYRVSNVATGKAESLSVAICLSCVGDGLLKCRQPRDAMLRLEEAVGIYRSNLGPFHIEVARASHAVAKALMKVGETRIALQKFTEAAQIYESCNATLHFDSISNSQAMAALLVELDEWGKAETKFEEVISMKKAVYGEISAPVAKAINNYAILLAKHGRMNAALGHYEAAKATFGAVNPSSVKDPEFELKCKYDITLINLNIASIKSKKGDLQGAINSYEEGVRGLREHEEAQELLGKDKGEEDGGKSHNKHLVAALGRIGSLKLKLGDTEGALEMYMMLLDEVNDSSPVASRIEKAKAHIKCATIFRQEDGNDSQIKSISHLRQALDMYTTLFGPEHKDTQAIASSLQQWLLERQEEYDS